jgi:spermidine/putrescine transport system ATP-binding protein
VVYQGSFKRVTAMLSESPDVNLLARLPANAPVKVNSSISLGVNPDELMVLKD